MSLFLLAGLLSFSVTWIRFFNTIIDLHLLNLGCFYDSFKEVVNDFSLRSFILLRHGTGDWRVPSVVSPC